MLVARTTLQCGFSSAMGGMDGGKRRHKEREKTREAAKEELKAWRLCDMPHIGV